MWTIARWTVIKRKKGIISLSLSVYNWPLNNRDLKYKDLLIHVPFPPPHAKYYSTIQSSVVWLLGCRPLDTEELCMHRAKYTLYTDFQLRTAGSRRETFHSWQRSWGRGLGIRKGGIEPLECPRIFSSIYPPKTRVCLLYCFVFSPLTLLGAVPHHHLTLSVKELTYSSN